MSPTGVQGPKYLATSAALQGALARSWPEAEQLRLQMAPKWDSRVTGGNLTSNISTLAPMFLYFKIIFNMAFLFIS